MILHNYLYLYGVFTLPFLLQIMTKIRKLSRGDIVKYHSYEWIVKRKRNGMINLIRRQVNTGPAIWVPRTRLKLSDQSWRHNLVSGDPVKLFLGGHWVNARIIRREGNKVCVQPSFTNTTIRLLDASGHIAQASHDYPTWQEDPTQLVMYQGEIRLERGKGLMFPWNYGDGAPVNQQTPKFIAKVQFPVVHTRGFPMKMYNSLSTDEIMYDVFHNSSSELPEILLKLASQYVNNRIARYKACVNNSVDIYVAAALDKDDTRRVNELLSIGSNTSVWAMSEFALCRHHSRTYLIPNISYDANLETITIEIYWSGVRTNICPNIKKILKLVSTPMRYQPNTVEVHGSPEIAYCLSKMLGMETEPLEKLYLRHVGEHWLTLQDGFCTKSLKTYGGVIEIPQIDYTTLVRELVRRSPLKTLIVVENDTLPLWKDFSLWHGNRREDDLVVVTTRATLLRCWTSLNGFKRLICTAIPKKGTVYHHVISNMHCRVRWAFWSDPGVTSDVTFNVLGLPYHFKGVLRLSKPEMENMGVLFPVKTIQKILCKPKHDTKHIVRNIAHMSFNKRKEYMSKFLLNPNFVPPHVRGEKLDAYNATLDSIAEKFNVSKQILGVRVKETCAICLETISNPAVTPCGHVFCGECAAELDKRNINCAMCRAKVQGYMRVSDENTPGKIVMHRGSCYRVQDDNSWGSKYTILKEHTDATFVTQYGSVKRQLRKAFPKTNILTMKSIESGLKVNTSKIIMVEPGKIPNFDTAWGKDLEIITLGYSVKL